MVPTQMKLLLPWSSGMILDPYFKKVYWGRSYINSSYQSSFMVLQLKQDDSWKINFSIYPKIERLVKATGLRFDSDNKAKLFFDNLLLDCGFKFVTERYRSML